MERRFIRAQARTCGFGPDRVGWKLGCAFGGRVLCICAANDRWPLCAQSVRKSDASKDFELEMDLDVKEISLFVFCNEKKTCKM